MSKDERIKQQEKLCGDTIDGYFSSNPIDLDCGCGCPCFSYNPEYRTYECENCGNIAGGINEHYTEKVEY